MWLENAATKTRPGAFLMTWRMSRPTAASDGVKPGRVALVESESRRSTPEDPNLLMAWKLGRWPSMGVWSNLKSPVCMTVPAGVDMNTPKAAGIECVIEKNVMVKAPSVMVEPSFTSRNLGERMLCSASLPWMKPSVSLLE